jgi:hypothetical protein
MDEKMWYVYIMEYYSAMKRMKSCHVQEPILNEISQELKDKLKQLLS